MSNCWGPGRQEWAFVSVDCSAVKALSQRQLVGDYDSRKQSPSRALAFVGPLRYEQTSLLLDVVRILTRTLACRVPVLPSPRPQENAGQAGRAAPLCFHFFRRRKSLAWWECGFCCCFCQLVYCVAVARHLVTP